MAIEVRKNKEIKKVLSFTVVLAFLLLLNSSAYCLDVMGPPVAELEFGQVRAGLDFTSSKMDLEMTNGLYDDYIDGIWIESGEALDVKLKDFKINRTYVNVGYGLGEGLEAFLRIGGANAKFDDSIWLNDEEFTSGAEFSAGGGIKFTFYREGDLKLGGLFQANMSSFDGELSSINWPSSDFVEVSTAEMQFALGASGTVNENISIYGGPYLHFVSGDLEDNISELYVNPSDSTDYGLLTSEFTWDIEEESILGGYLGVQMNFAENCSFNIEYQHTANAGALGMSLIGKF